MVHSTVRHSHHPEALDTYVLFRGFVHHHMPLLARLPTPQAPTTDLGSSSSSSSTTEVRSHRSRPLRLVDTLGEALTIQGSNDDLFTSGSGTESVVPLAHPSDDRSTTPRDPPEIGDASWDTPGRPPDGL